MSDTNKITVTIVVVIMVTFIQYWWVFTHFIGA